MFEKGMNDRAQSFSFGTMFALILGVVVLVVVVLFATGFFDDVSRASEEIPQSLQIVVSACEAKAGSGASLKVDYCTELREVELDGEKQYVTCKWLEVEKDELFEETPDFDCGSEENGNLVEPSSADQKAACGNKKDRMVNGVSCEVILAESSVGEDAEEVIGLEDGSEVADIA